MLFTPENAQKVMTGLKTQTRRPEKEGDAGYEASGRIMSVYRNGRLRWHVGLEYAVQPGRGKIAIGRIRLKSIRRERVNAITASDAFAEGIRLPTLPEETPEKFTAAFRELWNSIYSGGMAFDTGPMVWALEFEVSK